MECPTCPTLNATSCPAPGLGAILFTAFLSKLLKSQCELMNTRPSFPPDAASHIDPYYDFVVVGAGTAGSVVAARLSENPHHKVLLLEAGGDPPLESEVPVFASYYYNDGNTPYNWNYEAEWQPEACLGLRGERCPWVNGKMIGGSGSHNSMAFVRGIRSNFDHWASLGNEGWSYEDVLPFFRMSEKVTAEDILSLEDSARYHGTDGPLNLIHNTFYIPAIRALQEAAIQFNYRYIVDLNRETNLGVGFFQFNIANGTRCSTAKAFLGPAKDRANLHLVRNALVTQLVIDDHSKSVTGVRFRLKDQTVGVKVRKEVIVSAGANKSPQMLMLSGVGPSEHLGRLGISTVVDNPEVGRNLVSHLFFYGLVLGFEKSPENVIIRDKDEAAFRYLQDRTGPLSYWDSADSFVMFLSTNSSAPDPNIQVLTPVYTDATTVRELGTIYKFKKDVVNYIEDLVRRYDVILPFIALLRPLSKGQILLKSLDPEDPPLIEAGFLRAPEDVDDLLAAVEHVMAVGKAAPGVKMVTSLPVEECSHLEAMSREFWRCSLPYGTYPSHHDVGTCAMGKVLDSRLRVRGLRNLRVGDASVMPAIVSASTSATTTMVGERAAHLINEDWDKPRRRLRY